MPLLHTHTFCFLCNSGVSSGLMILCPFSFSLSPKFDILILCSLVHFISQDAAEPSWTGPHTPWRVTLLEGCASWQTDSSSILCAPGHHLKTSVALESSCTLSLHLFYDDWMYSFGRPWLTCCTGWGRVLGRGKISFYHVMEIVEQADVLHKQHCLLHNSVSLVHFLFGKLEL